MNKEFIVSSELAEREQFNKKVEDLENKYGVKHLTADDIRSLKFDDKISHIERSSGRRMTYQFLGMHPNNENYCFLMDSWTKKETMRLYIPDTEDYCFYHGYNSEFLRELAILYHAREIAYYMTKGEA